MTQRQSSTEASQTTVVALVSQLNNESVVQTFDYLENAYSRREYLARVSPHITETDYAVRHVKPINEDVFVDIETGKEYINET